MGGPAINAHLLVRTLRRRCRMSQCGIKHGAALFECNEILKAVSDSFHDLSHAPCGGRRRYWGLLWPYHYTKIPGQEADELPMASVEQRYVWTALLRVHAARYNADSSISSGASKMRRIMAWISLIMAHAQTIPEEFCSEEH